MCIDGYGYGYGYGYECECVSVSVSVIVCVCVFVCVCPAFEEVNDFFNRTAGRSTYINYLLRLLPLALQPTVGFGMSNNVLPSFPICHQLSPSSHSQHLKISFYFLFPSFPGSSPSFRPFQLLSEDLFGHPILLHSL